MLDSQNGEVISQTIQLLSALALILKIFPIGETRTALLLHSIYVKARHFLMILKPMFATHLGNLEVFSASPSRAMKSATQTGFYLSIYLNQTWLKSQR